MGGDRIFVVVGAGLAGAKAVETLRAEGFDGRLVLLGEEDRRPYERPSLSKEFLRGAAASWVHPAGFYADNDIELRVGERVAALDRENREVVLVTGERIPFDRLLLATGATARPLAVPGANRPNVHYLRTMADAEALRSAMDGAERIAVIGGGWIGTEVAASVRRLGRSVSLVERRNSPLQTVLGVRMGEVFRDLHAENGVDMHMGVTVTEIVDDGVRTDHGLVEADLVVVGAGVRPRVELARAAGLSIEDGIVVNEYLETSSPGIYAAGDVATVRHPLLGRKVRVEHWANALGQGPMAARNMLGHHEVHAEVPFFFSDQYDLGMEFRGVARPSDELVVRGDVAAREFIAFWLSGGRVMAAMNVNVWDAGELLDTLIAQRAEVSGDLLRSASLPSLVRSLAL
ncbi:NAD(P)/FAD-dependent oxidoreductase [Allokutzneria albata]|uniref:3-phenylpropionate/trans-cinnamate dioxygenase ferredoxin reductase subunit n=1 Tax=Allokutzneria albata TaxID=211114 RepID=A0A1G9VY52_ALLAB|nr:FAD-dependent oxidoreductase [Allokutzneria albata]SDM76695.1 3-phenylpropionate/trans-cinnamate dioxygenase ferredoxin reductase subunit [Allokutzneria albata]